MTKTTTKTTKAAPSPEVRLRTLQLLADQTDPWLAKDPDDLLAEGGELAGFLLDAVQYLAVQLAEAHRAIAGIEQDVSELKRRLDGQGTIVCQRLQVVDEDGRVRIDLDTDPVEGGAFVRVQDRNHLVGNGITLHADGHSSLLAVTAGGNTVRWFDAKGDADAAGNPTDLTAFTPMLARMAFWEAYNGRTLPEMLDLYHELFTCSARAHLSMVEDTLCGGDDHVSEIPAKPDPEFTGVGVDEDLHPAVVALSARHDERVTAEATAARAAR